MLVATGMLSLVHALIDFDHLFQNGWHPLWHASYDGRTDLVELLLIKSRANVNLATEVCGFLNYSVTKHLCAYS